MFNLHVIYFLIDSVPVGLVIYFNFRFKHEISSFNLLSPISQMLFLWQT